MRVNRVARRCVKQIAGTVALLWLSVLGVSGLSQDVQRPNIVVLIADDLAWDDLGCYGNPSVKTPNLDTLAAQGIRYDSAFLTCSSCSPSRSSILTGRYPHMTGASELHQPLPADQILCSQLLKDVGYYTAAIGKWHLGAEAQKQFDRVRQGGGPGGEAFWVEELRARPKDKPFFFWLAAFDPHRDYEAGAIEEPHDPKDVVVPEYFPDVPEVRADLAAYYDEIARFDSYVGQVLEELESQGVADNTLVVVLSDNGRPFPACKTRVTCNGIKTPLLFRWPDMIAANTVCQSLVSSVDLAPTLLEVAGVTPAPSFVGVSMVPTFTDSSAAIREFAFAEHNWHDYRAFERAVISSEGLLIVNEMFSLPATPPADAVRSPTYITMMQMNERGELSPIQADVFRAPRDREELYLWPQDLGCSHNVFADPSNQSLREQLQQALQAWQAETADRIPGVDELTPDKYDRRTGRLPE